MTQNLSDLAKTEISCICGCCVKMVNLVGGHSWINAISMANKKNCFGGVETNDVFIFFYYFILKYRLFFINFSKTTNLLIYIMHLFPLISYNPIAFLIYWFKTGLSEYRPNKAGDERRVFSVTGTDLPWAGKEEPSHLNVQPIRWACLNSDLMIPFCLSSEQVTKKLN